jgi:hypothetical protein
MTGALARILRAFAGAEMETAWNGSPEAQLAVGSLTSNFRSPEYAHGLGRDRFAFRADRFGCCIEVFVQYAHSPVGR